MFTLPVDKLDLTKPNKIHIISRDDNPIPLDTQVGAWKFTKEGS